jgi:outer membrane protein assembly factor BamD (BamD/ComL family)
VLAAVCLAAACGAKNDRTPIDPAQADRYLLQRANEAMTKKKWVDAREYFREVVENYPLSPVRA